MKNVQKHTKTCAVCNDMKTKKGTRETPHI